jgi:RNA polymerase sigma-70 factor (ECF subfamily)
MPTLPRDDAGFETEALCWLPDLRRYARSLTRDETDADDLVQDTYLTAYEQWHQFAAGTECRAWLFTICRHRFYRTRERAGRQQPVEDAELEALAAAALHQSAQRSGLTDAFERTEIREAVQEAIAGLPEVFRDVALLVDLHDNTYDEASRILGVPVGTVRSRLFRARRLLQERLLAHARDAGFGRPTPVTGPQGTPA